MTGEEIIRIARARLADAVEPFLWDPFVMVNCLNEAIKDFCRETLVLSDSTTEDICRIYLVSGQNIYALDPRILMVKSARLSEASWPLGIVYADELDTYYPGWRTHTGTPTKYVPEFETQKILLYPYYDDDANVSGSGNISFVALSKTIQKPSGLDVFTAGDTIQISGTTSNNGLFTVISASSYELVVSGPVVDEENTSAEIRKVLETLWISVYRLPLEPFTLENLDNQIEIPEIYHEKLVPGIMKYAYLNDDERTLDIQKSSMYEAKFLSNIAMAKIDHIKRVGRWNSTVGVRTGCV